MSTARILNQEQVHAMIRYLNKISSYVNAIAGYNEEGNFMSEDIWQMTQEMRDMLAGRKEDLEL